MQDHCQDLSIIHELLVASQQFSRWSSIKRDLPPASKYNKKICSKMITSIIRYHTAIHYIMSITRDRFQPCWVSSGGCILHPYWGLPMWLVVHVMCVCPWMWPPWYRYCCIILFCIAFSFFLHPMANLFF